MADKKKQAVILGIAAVGIFLLLRTGQTTPQVVQKAADNFNGSITVPGGEPSSGWIPGQYEYFNIFGPNGPMLLLGGDTTINMPDAFLASLSRAYIPMFGFVGVTGVGAL